MSFKSCVQECLCTILTYFFIRLLYKHFDQKVSKRTITRQIYLTVLGYNFIQMLCEELTFYIKYRYENE